MRAFQSGAFQKNAFQITGIIPPPPPVPQRFGYGFFPWLWDDKDEYEKNHEYLAIFMLDG